MTHFDGLDTLDGRHLIAIYAFVLLLQAGYATWIFVKWRRLSSSPSRLPDRTEHPL